MTESRFLKIDEIDIDIRQENHIIEAAEAARQAAAKLGLGAPSQYMVATAVSELATNIRRYAGQGTITVRSIDRGNQQGIEIIARDEGPGIADLEASLRDNFSTSGSLGIGLPGTRRLMDEFEIETGAGKGTCVTIRKWR